MPSTKSLPSAENAFLRGLVQKVLESAATQTEAAQRLGVSQSYLNEFIGGTRGAGPKLLKGLAKLNPKKSARLLGLADDDPGASSADPRTEAERAVDAEFGNEFDTQVLNTLVEAVQYAAQRGPRFFRQTWWRILLDDRKSVTPNGHGIDPIALGERLVARAQAADDEARRDRFIALHGTEDEEDDKRPTLPAPPKNVPARRGTRKDTPVAKKAR
ncbi:MAG TPA: helix-turn-helix transcriptional regulator [Polyangiaceae bacterium]|jgi:transcriptional regulator with XRE-family HTH domain|nr:helix-turn-helix transcriptional regulator [Polyangiaceae bacterium]